MPNTVEDLGDLDEGFILILGNRRCGKSFFAQKILDHWDERKTPYRYFSHNRPSSGSQVHFGGSPSVKNLEDKMRGYERVLIDEPGQPLRTLWDPRVLVIATSDPEPWMLKTAGWFVRVSHDAAGYRYAIDQTLPPVPPPPPPPTIWERLLLSV